MLIIIIYYFAVMFSLISCIICAHFPLFALSTTFSHNAKAVLDFPCSLSDHFPDSDELSFIARVVDLLHLLFAQQVLESFLTRKDWSYLRRCWFHEG